MDKVNNEIVWLAVSKEYQRNRYGEQLVKYAIEELGNNKDILVQAFAKDVNEGMSARGLYQKLGFEDLKSAGENPAGFETVIMAKKMTQSYNIYVVHGYTASSQANWYPDLKNNLASKGIVVHVFDMPNSHNPTEKEWLDFLEAKITNFDEKSIFIGHSLGCVAILRFLEDKNMNNIESLFLVSGFVEDSPISELSEFVKRKINYSKFIETIKNRVVVSAEDDDIIPYQYSEILAKKLNAQFVLLKNGRHFIDRDGFTEFTYLINLVKKQLSNIL